jgi:predicted ATPase
MKGAVDKIKIKGFKSIREAEIDLKPLNVLIGHNGVGKSNFLGIFKFIHHIFDGRLQYYTAKSGGASSLLHFGRKKTPSMLVDFTFSDQTFGYSFELFGNDQDVLLLAKESKLQYNDLPPHIAETESNVASFVGSTESHYSNPKRGGNDFGHPGVSEIESWRVYHMNDTSPEAKVKESCDLHDNRFLKADASNLAAFLYKLRQNSPQHYQSIIEVIRMAAPFFDRLILEPLELNPNKIRLEWTERDNDYIFGPNSLSDGTLRFAFLATLLLQPQLPSTLLLDEPELGLHPSAINLLAELLQSAATKTHVIVSTQSVNLVNQFAPEDILVVEREDGQSTFKRLEPGQIDSWLEEYGLGELWEKNLIGGRP